MVHKRFHQKKLLHCERNISSGFEMKLTKICSCTSSGFDRALPLDGLMVSLDAMSVFRLKRYAGWN